MNRFSVPAEPSCPAEEAMSVRVSDTHDAEEQAACLINWGQCYEQMSSGSFDGHFESYRFDGVELFCEETNQVVQQYGQPHASTITMAALRGTGEGSRFCGASVGAEHYCLLRGGSEFHFRTPQRARLAAVTVDHESFAAYCRRVGELSPPRACANSGLVQRRPDDDLGAALASLMHSIQRTPEMLRHATLRRCLAEGLHSMLLGLCSSTEVAGKDLTASTRQYVVNKARDYMREHVEEPITVSDLCAHIRVSRRTLQYSFQDVLGTNPARYLRNMRLNGARREIRRQSDEHAPLADIAAHWGFWHPSRFAAEYKSLFGDLPSQTLRASARL